MCATFRASHLEGFDAVLHLAALSNDPLGNIDRELTLEINHRASVRLAQRRVRRACSVSCSRRRAAATARQAKIFFRKTRRSTRSHLMGCRRC
jgi:hypothetical protein